MVPPGFVLSSQQREEPPDNCVNVLKVEQMMAYLCCSTQQRSQNQLILGLTPPSSGIVATLSMKDLTCWMLQTSFRSLGFLKLRLLM